MEESVNSIFFYEMYTFMKTKCTKCYLFFDMKRKLILDKYSKSVRMAHRKFQFKTMYILIEISMFENKSESITMFL